MKDDECQEDRSGQPHIQRRPTRLLGNLYLIGLRPGLSVLGNKAEGSPSMQDYASQKKNPRTPQDKPRETLQAVGVFVDLFLTRQNLQVTSHMNENKANQNNAREGHDVLFSE
jgi:hypothetical protein